MVCECTVFKAASETWLPMASLANFLLTFSLCDPYYTQKVYVGLSQGTFIKSRLVEP